MMLIKLKAALGLFIAVFLCLQNVTVAESENSKKCITDFDNLRNAYFKSNIEATVIQSVQSHTEPLSLMHMNKGNIDYTTWKSLNDEVVGYSLRQNKGFDFNQNRGFIGPLIWHQSRIWDRFFSKKTVFDDYECGILGRTRLAGRKVTLIRLNPKIENGFVFVVAKDADTSLPVELSVFSQKQNLLAKFTVTAVHYSSSLNVSVPNETFDRIEKMSATGRVTEKVWPELNIPNGFKLMRTGVQQGAEHGKDIPYQMYSDGLVDFKVFKNTKGSLNIVSATEGTLSVMRRNSKNFEYAVVGEIPLEMCAQILSNIK